MEEKKENEQKGCLLQFGILVLGFIILVTVAMTCNLVLKGKRAAAEMFYNDEDNVIDELRGAFILLIVVGVVYLIIRNRKK